MATAKSNPEEPKQESGGGTDEFGDNLKKQYEEIEEAAKKAKEEEAKAAEGS